ncbi:MAG: MMPL family transporter [Deltaproteobacteria bacterium]|nr:MMPL family transporter [Deltaproteobacteria bacterium]
MKEVLFRLNQFFALIPEFLTRNRWKAWVVLVVLSAAVGAGSGSIKLNMSLDSFFKEGDPTRKIYDLFRYTFESDESVYLVYEANDGDIFSERSLSALSRLHKQLTDASLEAGEDDPLNHVTTLTSLINASYLEVRGDDLVSRDFIGDDLPTSLEVRERLRAEALKHPDYPMMYLSGDSRYGAILIGSDLGTELEDESWEAGPVQDFGLSGDGLEKKTGKPEFIPKYKQIDQADYTLFWNAVEAIFDRPEYKKDLTFYPVGNPVMMDFLLNDIMSQVSYLFIGMFVLMFFVLLWLFRSFSGVVLPFAVVILSAVVTFGIIGWVGIEMNMMIQVVFLLVITVGIADSLHILSGYLYFRRQGQDYPTAMRSVMKKSGLACLLTSLTTAVGMISLMLVPIGPIQNFGIGAGLGVLVAYLMTMVFLPMLMDIWNPYGKKREAKKKDPSGYLVQRMIMKLEPVGKKHPKKIVLIYLLLTLFFLYGFFQVQIDSNIVEIVREGYGFKEAYNIVDQKLGGTQNLEIVLDLKKTDALKDPEVLNRMEVLQNYMEGHDSKLVVDTLSLVNIVKSTFQTLNQDKKEMYVIPQEPNTLAQTLLLFDNTNRDDRVKIVPDDYSQARISSRMLNAGSKDYVVFFSDIQREADRVFEPLKKNYPELKVSVTGGVALLMTMTDYISWAQVKSFLVALAVVSLIILVVFGSLKVGIIAMLPNLFPVILTFGLMGLFNMPLDTDTLIIAPIIIGISVDDTIHFITHYRAEYLLTKDIHLAIENTLKEAGQAISFTSLVLVIGFLVMVPSIHLGLSRMGLLSAVAIFSAWTADMLLLPALLVLAKARFKAPNNHSESRGRGLDRD